MRIISSYLPAEPSALMGGRPTIVAAFDTLVDQKSVVVGITVGRMEGPDIAGVVVHRLGQLVIERAGAHHQLNYPHGEVVVAGVASVAGAKERTRQVLTQAPPQALVLLICANDKVYDAAYEALGIDVQAMKVGPQ
jgi:hypothetical protein